MKQIRNQNFKNNGLIKAKAAFIEDVKNDRDFVEYRKKAFQGNYGVVNATRKFFIIEAIAPTCETIISKYHKGLV